MDRFEEAALTDAQVAAEMDQFHTEQDYLAMMEYERDLAEAETAEMEEMADAWDEFIEWCGFPED